MWLRSTNIGVRVLFETLTYNNIENWYYKVKQLLKNETENSLITKLLQSAKEFYCKVRQVLQSVTEVYYKVSQVLQSATVMTKWDVTKIQ